MKSTKSREVSTDRLNRHSRVGHANDLIKIIASHGRRFFWNATHQRTASIQIDANLRVWWIDDYSGAAIYTHHESSDWKGFSHGGTLKSLVCAMRRYIVTGETMHREYIAPERMNPGSNIWGYDTESAIAVRAAAFDLPIMSPAAIISV